MAGDQGGFPVADFGAIHAHLTAVPSTTYYQVPIVLVQKPQPLKTAGETLRAIRRRWIARQAYSVST